MVLDINKESEPFMVPFIGHELGNIQQELHNNVMEWRAGRVICLAQQYCGMVQTTDDSKQDFSGLRGNLTL